MTRAFTDAQVRSRLSEATTTHGTKAFARTAGVPPHHLREMLTKDADGQYKRPVSPRVMEALGLERVTTIIARRPG